MVEHSGQTGIGIVVGLDKMNGNTVPYGCAWRLHRLRNRHNPEPSNS